MILPFRSKNPKVAERPTLSFEQDEMIGIAECCSGPKNVRLRALSLLFRYSGLRIKDAVTLARTRIKDGHLFLYTSKAGTPVYCLLPKFVVTAPAMIPVDGPYFFWTGNSKIKTVCSHWDLELRKLFKQAKVENGHAHRFRDTFGVSLLIAGKLIEHVAMLLGHRSIRIAERHYSPCVSARQEQLEADVRDSWKSHPVVLLQTKGTAEVRGKAHCVN